MAGKSVDGLAQIFAPSRPASIAQGPQLAAELRSAVAALPPLPQTAPGEAEDPWVRYLGRIRDAIQNDSLESFTRWPVIRETMFIGNSATAIGEWRELRRSPQFDRYKPILEESGIGRPAPFLWRPRTSGLQVHHTYFLWQFESLTHSDVSGAKLVFEFGGGYGSMCRQFYGLGFTGRYVIFDLPEFSHLQRYYLQSLGLPVLTAEQWLATDRGILLVSDIAELQRVFAGGLGRGFTAHVRRHLVAERDAGRVAFANHAIARAI